MGDQGIIKIGPGGVEHGSSWDEKGHSKIFQIFISHDEKIHSIQFQYLENGTLVLSRQHGQLSNSKFDVIKFNHPEEYVTSISGTYTQRGSYSTLEHYLSSLSIGTNLHNYGPFGKTYNNSGHKEFRYNLGKDRQFMGFYGSGNSYVSSLGVYFKPLTTLDTIENNSKPGKKECRICSNFKGSSSHS